MNTEHHLPSTRIRAARIAARATEERLRRLGVSDRAAHGIASLAAGLANRFGVEMARDIATARAQSRETRHA